MLYDTHTTAVDSRKNCGYGNVTVGVVSVRPWCAVRGKQVATGQACAGPVDYLLKRVRMLKHYGVKPWVVLDGRRTPMKVCLALYSGGPCTLVYIIA